MDVNVVMATTISCDATILRCSRCQHEVAILSVVTAMPGTCTCGAAMAAPIKCFRSFSLHKDALLMRCIAENKEGWRCEDGGRDFCPDHSSALSE